MGIYEELGVRRLINANATLTRLGGSLLAPGVADAMAEAGRSFVELDELQAAVGREIARLTRNEACYVSSGAAAGLTLATAAAIAGTDPALRGRLPFTEGMKNEVIVHGFTRVGYDFAVRMAGVRLVEIGESRAAHGHTDPAELEAALTDRTAAMFYFPRGIEERGEIPLESAVALCRPRGIPVIVDAAAQIPPRSNLWSFTERGADAVIFSGGKGLRGPQSTGLILGRRDFVSACAYQGAPSPFIGRGMKVGKEELCGILAAVRWCLEQDEEAESAFYEGVVQLVLDAFREHPGVTARRIWPSEAGQPLARAELELDEARLGRTRDQIIRALREGTPSVDLAGGPGATLVVNPQTLTADEPAVVVRRLREVLAG